MKKIALLLSGILAAGAASAQVGAYTPVGASYTQNFDGLAGGLPTGWHVYTAATAASIGYLRDTSTKLFLTQNYSTFWSYTGGGFKNVASADNIPNYSALDTNAQLVATNRALAVRQVSGTSTSFPASDSGASFSFKLANTTGLTGLAATFNLQSLDSTSPRITTWTVDYGFGDAPTTFTPVMVAGTTGGNTFSNTPVTVNFGSALDNQAGPVWIRVVTLNNSTGASNRPTSGIDDFNLTWTGSASAIPTVSNTTATLAVLGYPTTSNMALAFTLKQAGNTTVTISDLNGRTVYTTNIAATAGSNTRQLSGLNLVPGAYIVRISNGTETGVIKTTIR